LKFASKKKSGTKKRKKMSEGHHKNLIIKNRAQKKKEGGTLSFSCEGKLATKWGPGDKRSKSNIQGSEKDGPRKEKKPFSMVLVRGKKEGF